MLEGSSSLFGDKKLVLPRAELRDGKFAGELGPFDHRRRRSRVDKRD